MGKHLTQESRVVIQTLLDAGHSLSAIAKEIGKHPTTIKNEIIEHSQDCLVGAYGRVTNRCIHRRSCTRYHLCEEIVNCTRKCSTCKLCNTRCPNYEEEHCALLRKPPYVCNGCNHRKDCTLRKIVYNARAAQKEYRETLITTRQGINTCEEDLLLLDEMITPLIRKGQSIHHITATHADRFSISERTLYRWLDGSLFTARNGDLPRKCCIKKRKKLKRLEHKVDTRCRIGRTYEDYLLLFEIFDQAPPIIYMDTVVSSKSRKTILTFHFVESHFMFARILPDKTSASVIQAFNDLETRLGNDTFHRLLPVILTDNGTEFSNPTRLEVNKHGFQRTSIYYCDPYESNQKAEIERNHEFLRLILPKGCSFETITQDSLDLIFSHINSYLRPSLNDKTPYALFQHTYGQDILNALNLHLIPYEEIHLTPHLLKN